MTDSQLSSQNCVKHLYLGAFCLDQGSKFQTQQQGMSEIQRNYLPEMNAIEKLRLYLPDERRSGNLDRPVSLLAPVQKPMERRDRGVSFEAAPTISAPTVNRINPQSPLDPEPRADQRKAAASIQMTPPAIPPISRPEPGFSPESAPSSRGGSQQDARTPQSSQSDPYQLPPTNGRAHSRVGSQADDSKSEADMYARELLSVAALEVRLSLISSLTTRTTLSDTLSNTA